MKRYSIYQQAILPSTLVDCISQTEWRSCGKKRDEMENIIGLYLKNSIVDGTYNFSIKQQGDLYLNAHSSGSIDALCQNLILRKITKTIKRLYYICPENRNHIIKQVKILLSEKCELWVLRLDIHHFYESIDRNRIMQELQERGRISNQTMMLLNKLFEAECVKATNGLPRGLSISAVLSEYYMKYFDIELKKTDGVYYYARYVDDIIVFCTSKNVQNSIYDKIVNELGQIALSLNQSKTIYWDSSFAGSLVYLGYSFKKNHDDVQVTIAPEKVKKIKTRITRTFVRFAKDGNYEDLLMRVKYLTGNFRLNKLNRMIPISVGLYYNYKFIDDFDCLDELQTYYEHILNLKSGKLGTRIATHLTRAQREKLQKYKFRFGYNKRVRYSFTEDQLNRIKSCWR